MRALLVLVHSLVVLGGALSWSRQGVRDATRTLPAPLLSRVGSVSRLQATSDSASSIPSVFEALRNSVVINPKDGSTCSAIDNSLLVPTIRTLFGNGPKRRILVTLFPQLGEFDSCEYAEQLLAVLDDLERASISLRVIGIGDVASAKRFCQFTDLPLEVIRVDPTAELYDTLGCHRGPDWEVPSWVPDAALVAFAERVGARPPVNADTAHQVARAWLNYLAMCAGISAPGTLKEILRGYIGDKNAPERLRDDETVTAGPIEVTGTLHVKIGPISYQNFWKDQVGYQRPVELATVRLRSMVEVLSNLDEYVPDQRYVDRRGATFLFDSNGEILYEYRSRGVLTYSETMERPLSFLSSFIGETRAFNPLGLGDPMQRR